ncbi:MAG: DUF3794 domain-containing protein [Thermoanaerobacteraceae bacterium]|nr:DUF3794 domain-containing protein [Thermoanaerobacteraceae bacterium]
MSIDVIKDVINLDRLIRRLSTQTMVTGDILVPDVKPDVEEIIGIDSELIIDGSEVTAGRVLVEGRMLSRILYATTQTDRPVAGITAVKEFSHYFDVADVDEEAEAEVRGYVEHTDYEVLNSRKLQLKHMVNLDIFLSKRERVEAITAIDLDDAMSKKEDIKVKFLAGDGSSETIVREDVSPGEDAGIRDILYVSAAIAKVEPQISDNKVLVEGTLNIDVIYMKDTEDIEYDSYSTDINFTHYVDVADVQAYMYPEVECVVEEVSAEPKDSSTISVEAVLDVRVKVFEEDGKTIVKDAYSITRNLKGNIERFTLLNEVYRSGSQISLKETVELSDDAQHILLIKGQAQPGEYELSDNKLYIEGVLPMSVYYAAESGIKYDMVEIPFRHVVDADDLRKDNNIDVRFNVSHLSYTLNGNAVDVRYTIDCNLRAYRENKLTYLSSVEEVEGEALPEMAGITIYVAEKGETLWDVAKRYRTTVDRIKVINELTDDNLEEGDKLLILKEIKK